MLRDQGSGWQSHPVPRELGETQAGRSVTSEAKAEATITQGSLANGPKLNISKDRTTSLGP